MEVIDEEIDIREDEAEDIAVSEAKSSLTMYFLNIRKRHGNMCCLIST